MSDARGGAWDVVIAGGGAAGVSVAAALLACADRLLVTSADPARPERITLYRLPFWHYTTPLQVHPRRTSARRWLVLGSFFRPGRSQRGDP